jgi:two-component system, cell cycle sensor histidine kinase and response regulator CckA
MQQDLPKETSDLLAENAALRAQVGALEGRVATLEAELAACRERTAQANATPAHATAATGFAELGLLRASERELREAESRFATVFHATPIALTVCTATDARILDANEQFLSLFGYERQAVIGRTSEALGMWADPDQRTRVFAAEAENGRIRDWQITALTVSGELRHVLLSMEPLWLGGRACRLTSVYDITDRVRAEAALRERDEWLQLAYDAAQLGTWRHDMATNRVRFDARAQAHYGCDAAEVLLADVLARVHPEDRPRLQGEIAWTPRPGNDDRYATEYRVVRPDETIRWLAVEARVFYAGNGEHRHPILSAGTSQDITERKQAQAALQQSEALYRAIARNLPDASVVIVDYNLRYLLADGPLLAAMGFGWEQLEGRTPADALSKQVAEAITARFRRALAGDEYTVESTYAERVLWSHYTPLRDEEGQIWAAMALTFDVTRRTRLEEQLRQAQKMESIGLLAGGIAHDFNNLLTAIGGFADLVHTSLSPEAEIRADIREIQRAADRATALTRQLLAFARRQRMDMRPLDLNALVANLERLLRRLIGEHIQLVVEPAPDLYQVVADAGQLEQVLVNLVVNARDAMPEGGSLTISTANVHLDSSFAHARADLPTGAYVLLAVSDTGVGIPPEVQPHLFEPFFTTKPVGQGTGLGLATSYGIVKQHRGTIWIYSEVGHGTVVKVYLPRSGAGKARPSQRDSLTALPRGSETVLVAEDEPSVRQLAARVLRACGYTVLEAADGEEALRVARAHAPEPIHLLLSDVVMPQLGGIELATQLRGLYPAQRVLFMSGYADLRSAPPDEGALEVPLLQKPFTPMGLATAVREVLDA